MRRSRYLLQSSFLEKLDRLPRADIDRHNLIIITVEYKDRNIDALQVLSEVRLGEGVDAIISVFEASGHALLPPAPDLALAKVGIRPVETEEWAGRNVDEELRSVLYHRVAERVECRARHACDQVRWHRADKNGFEHSAGAMAAQDSDYLTSACRVANHHCILKVELLHGLV